MRTIALFTLAITLLPLAAPANGQCADAAIKLATAFNKYEYPLHARATPKLELVSAEEISIDEGNAVGMLETWRVLYSHQDGYLVKATAGESCSANSIRTRAPGGKPVDQVTEPALPAYQCGLQAKGALQAYLVGRGYSSEAEKLGDAQPNDFGAPGYPAALGYEHWTVPNNFLNQPVVYRYQNGQCQFISVLPGFAG